MKEYVHPQHKRMSLIRQDIGRESYMYGDWFISKIGQKYHASKTSGLDQYYHLQSTTLDAIIEQIKNSEKVSEDFSFADWMLRESMYDRHLLKSVVMLGGPGSGKSYVSKFFF